PAQIVSLPSPPSSSLCTCLRPRRVPLSLCGCPLWWLVAGHPAWLAIAKAAAHSESHAAREIVGRRAQFQSFTKAEAIVAGRADFRRAGQQPYGRDAARGRLRLDPPEVSSRSRCRGRRPAGVLRRTESRRALGSPLSRPARLRGSAAPMARARPGPH